MAVFSDQGLVLRCLQHGEKNRLVYLLTQEHGVIHAFANGARGIQSRNFAATSQFVYGTYLLADSRDAYTIRESSAEASYADMNGDIEALALGQYFSELCMELVPEGTHGGEYLRLLRGALHYLCSATRDKSLIKAAFEMRIMSISGFMPDLLMCGSCGAYDDEEMRFYVDSGSIRCGACAAKGEVPTGGSVLLGSGALTAMRHSVFSQLEKLYSFTLADDALKAFSNAAEQYVISRLERSFRTLEFYRQLRI